MTIRQPCPPGACDCNREQLLERLENLQSLPDLERMQQLMYQQLGIRVHVAQGHTEVKTMRGIQIVIHDMPGLCRKTRQSIPAAIRKGMEKRPEIAGCP